jgi:exopolyphosphatase/pppGpp-phosphohydrolase
LENELEQSHPEQVAKVADQLFAVTRRLHSLGERERELLKAAALLHDIGWAGGQVKHHKHSQEMILQSPPDYLKKGDVAIVANVARYHRRALPSAKHPLYADMSSKDRAVVDKLSALIRIADGLDASHTSWATVTNAQIRPASVVIVLSGDNPSEYDIASAQKKADLFEKVFNRTVSFRVEEPQAL